MLSPAIDRPAERRPKQATDARSSALSIREIAELSDSVMSDLTREELIQLIDAAAAQVPLGSLSEAPRLQLRDSKTLRRLAHLARFTCRNQICCQSLDGSS